MIVIWIKHLTNRTCKILLLNSFLIISFVKRTQVECINCLCIPYAQRINHIILITNDWHIIWYGTNTLIIFLNKLVLTILILADRYISTKLNFYRIFRTFDLKRVAIFQPIIRLLNLIAILNRLLEHSIFVTNSTTVCRIS